MGRELQKEEEKDNMNRLYNKRRKYPPIPQDAVYIGRGSPYGNPYKVGFALGEHSREEAIVLFEDYARKRLLREPDWLEPLKGRSLVCFCHPKACHGDVLLALIQEIYGVNP